jgi:thymidylate synthase
MNNIEHDYLKLLHEIVYSGVDKDTRNGRTRSVFGRQIRHDMSLGFPLLTTKKMPFKTIATELVWFLRGDTNIKFLNDNNVHIWDGDAYRAYEKWHERISKTTPFTVPKKFTQEELIQAIKLDDKHAEMFGELGPIYGRQWRNWNAIFDGGVDQIKNLIQDLKTNPDSRRLMVNAWNVGELDQMVLPPCHYGFQVYTRELSLEERRELVTKEMFNQIYNGGGPDTLSHSEINQWNVPTRAISLMWNQRSVDTFLGLPFNIASYGLLLEIIAQAVNMIPDQLIGNLGDVHLYENHLDQAKEQLTRQPYPLPTLNINTEFWPTETGEAGLGEIDAVAVFDGFTDDAYCKCFFEDLQLSNYESHPHIKAPLSN